MATKGANVLGVLKQKLAASKADADKYQEECEILQGKLTAETSRAEEAENETKALERRIQLLQDNLG